MKSDSINNKVIEEILATQWHHLGKWIEPALAAELWLDYAAVAQQFFKNKLNGEILYLNGNFFLSKHDVESIEHESYKAARSHNNDFFDAIATEVGRVTVDLVQKVKHATDVDLFLTEYKELTGVWMPLNSVAVGIEKYVQEVAPEAFSLARGFIDEKPWTLQQIDEMHLLKKSIIEKLGELPEAIDALPDDLAAQVEEHVKKYEWVGTHHFNINGLTPEKLFERMRQEKEKEEPEEKPVDSETNYLVHLLNLVGYVRFKCAETSGYTTFFFSKVLTELAQKRALTYEDIVEHTMVEIKEGTTTKEIALTRKANTGFYYGGEEHILSADETKQCEEALLKKVDDKAGAIKGLAAYKGKVVGKVKIVTRQDQTKGFEEGMVLVAYETTPDIVFAMQKSAAIVTDFGGLTCHAAIVARELKKPCIVGTGNATKVLKDGNMVEVDADNGIVRKL